MNNVTCSINLPKGGPLVVDLAKAATVAAYVGIPPSQEITIQISLRHPKAKEQGFTGGTAQVNPSTWQVEVYVLPRSEYSEKSLYRLNNTLVHEFRHIAQDLFGFAGKGAEPEAQTFGRLAHYAEFCAITAAVAPETAAVLWVCDECGPVDLVGIIDDSMGTEAVYLHDTPDCPGSVEPTIVAPEG